MTPDEGPSQLQNLAELCNGLSAASLHEAAGRIGALPGSIKPLAQHFVVAGRAFPVSGVDGDNLYLHHAIYAASPGDVLVAATGRGADFGYWGDIMTAAAQVRGLAGLIITGGVRDCRQIIAMNFPVFAGGVCIRGTVKNASAPGSLGEPVSIGGVTIRRGDFVFGDAEGVVVLPAATALTAMEKARQRDVEEDTVLRRLQAGESTLNIYGLPNLAPPSDDRPRQRRSVIVPSLAHGNLPIPTVSRTGPLVATGGIRGNDPSTGAMRAGAQAQVDQMFQNLRIAIEATGATLDDILKVTVWIADPAARSALNGPWEQMFPHADSRPARHVLASELPGGMLVQCEALAYVLSA